MNALAAAGARVACADIAFDPAGDIASAIRQAGGIATAVECDVSDRISVAAARNAACAELGPASLLVDNAGVTQIQPLAEMTDDDVDWQLQADLHGVFHCIRAFRT